MHAGCSFNLKEMKRVLLPAILAVSFAMPAHADYRGTSTDVFGYSSIEALLAALRQKPSAVVSKRDGWTVVSVNGGLEIWSITPTTHPAYPSVARRRMVKSGDGWTMNTNISCQAAKPKCDELVRDYQKLDEDMRKNIQAEQEKKARN